MKLIALSSLVFFLFISCNKNDISDLQGDWVSWMSYPFSEIDEFRIQGDSIFLSDRYNHDSKGTIQLDGDSLKVDLGSGEKYSFAINLITDSSFVLNDATFERYVFEDFWNELSFEFIDIEARNTQTYKFAWGKIYYYKNRDGYIQLHSGETEFEYPDLTRYLRRPGKVSKKDMVPTVFVGKGIDLVDLQILYEYIRLCGYQKVKLITRRNGISSYESVELRIWNFEEYQIDLEEKLKKYGSLSLPPMPPPLSVKELLDKGCTEINLRSDQDFDLLKQGDFRKPAIVLVDSVMSMKDYVKLQLRIAEIETVHLSVSINFTLI